MYILGTDLAQYGHIRLWAENGIVHWEDARDNSYGSMSVRSALHRIKALSDMLGNTRADRKESMDEAFRMKLQSFVEAGVAVCEKAREQGEPTDPSAGPDRLRRLPKTVCMPSAAAIF